MRLEDISISLNSNIFSLIVGIIILAAYSFYVYKFTIPQVSPLLRYILLFLRITSIALLFLLIFEPILNLTSQKAIEPVTYLFIDNSNSIAAKDSVQRSDRVKNIVAELKTSNVKINPFLFSNKVNSFNADSFEAINFKGYSTNFYNLIAELKNSEDNISSAVIISDGIINDGSSPVFEAEKLNFPIFTIGIGDISQYRDIKISDVIFNQYIYAQKPTVIEIIISQFGFENSNTRVTLFENDKPVSSQDVQLNVGGINKINLGYIPQSSGEIKMSINISPITGEDNLVNNSKTFFINVLKNKIKVGLIAGSPSADLSSFSNALESDNDLEIKKIIQVSTNKFWKDYDTSIIDSSDILFFIDFPSSSTPQNLIAYISTQLQNKSKPFFFLFSQNVDIDKLKQLENSLPFIITKKETGFVSAEPNLTDNNSISSGFSNSIRSKNVWENLPPIIKSNSLFIAKPGSGIIANSIIRNLQSSAPLIITRSIGNHRSIAIMAGDIWKWELSTSEKYPGFFSNMISDFTKWLNVTDKQKQFVIKTSKKIYSVSEPVEFTAELYDQTFSPIDSANVSVTINKEELEYDIDFPTGKSGIYKTEFDLTRLGDYTYYGSANFNGTTIKSDLGRFRVSESNIEKENTQMDENFLKLLATSTNGKYFLSEDIDELKEELERMKANSSSNKILESEIDFRSNEWIMLIIICLFAVEWFIRKRSGML